MKRGSVVISSDTTRSLRDLAEEIESQATKQGNEVTLPASVAWNYRTHLLLALEALDGAP